MHKSWRFIPSLKAFAVILGAIAVLSLSISGAWAQTAGDSPGAVKKYVFMSSGATWGAAQDAAIARLGAALDYRHAGSGIGIATSADPDFLKAAMKSGAFSKGGEDFMVQWQAPEQAIALEDTDIGEDVVNASNDRFINALWNMQAIDAPGAWAAGYDGTGARVAVLDGGTCDLHPDVAPNLDIARSTSFVPGFTFNQDTGPATAFRHACHVAGIIAAVDNTIGTVGVAPKATIIAVKVLHNGSGSFGQVISGILYAADPISAGGGGANIINMSLGATFAKGGGNTGAGALVAAMNQAVNYATSQNVLVVCSAGNNGIDMDHSGSITSIPAQSGSALSISATGPTNWVGNPPGNFSQPATYTNYGHQAVWVSAPGGNDVNFGLPGNCGVALVSPPGVAVQPCWVWDFVLSPGSQSGSYFFAEGTSMAAPHVSGVAALLVQKYPGISVGDLKTLIAQTAVNPDGGNGASPFHGHGFLNANNAVSGTMPQLAAKPAKPEVMASAGKVELAIYGNGGASPQIAFTMPASGPARVDLYDVAGRRVAELFNGQAAAGRNLLLWTTSLRQGTYFARLTAGGVQTAKQVVFLGQ